MTVNFISIENSGYGVSEFTKGSSGKFVSKEEFLNNNTLPMSWAGAFRPEYLNICKTNKLKFYNFDSGYFGNRKAKIWLRITVNGYQNFNEVVERPSDRWGKLEINLEKFSRGSDIVIVPPDNKIADVLGLKDPDTWTFDIINEIKKISDRNVRIRNRPSTRTSRMVSNTFKDFIRENTWCVIGYSSNSLVEAAMCGIPVISLGESATRSLYKESIENIEEIKPADSQKLQQWLNHLSYCQFNREELLSGYAWDVLNHI